MSPRSTSKRIQRILVAIDASRHSLAGLQAAVDLAEKIDAELVGLFVEDINLLRMGGMPISSQMGRYSMRRRQISADEVLRQLRTQASWARQAFERLSRNPNLRWSFQVVRGTIPSELIRATGDTDLIILGKTGWSDMRLMGSTTQAILTQGGLTLILREGVRLGNSVMVLYDGSEEAREAREIAGQLLADQEGRLVVLLVAQSKDAAESMRAEFESWNELHGFKLVSLWAQVAEPSIICNIAMTEGSGLLVLPKGSPLLSNEEISQMLNEIRCPVMFVGGGVQERSTG
jgi:nucleotide-binding universal stress UspA family protein